MNRRLAAVSLLVVVLGTAVPAQAQEPPGEPLEVRFEADAVPATEPVRVTESYRLRLEAGVERIPLLGLHFLGARIEALEAELDGASLAFETSAVAGEQGASTAPGSPGAQGGSSRRSPLFLGDLRLPRPIASSGEHELTLRYEVRDALRRREAAFDLVVPVLVVDWPPTTAPPDMFGARLLMPADHHITSAFPTVDRATEVRDGARAESFRLQVTPSVIRYRGTVGEPPVLTRGRLVDLGVGLFLLGLLAWGMVRWRRSLAGADG